MTYKRLTTPTKRHGGKHYLAPWLVTHFPKFRPMHRVHVFGGGGSDLLACDPEGVSEVFNDCDLELTNFWKTMQSEDAFAQFQRIIQAVPHSQYEFDNAIYPDNILVEEMPNVQAAVCFFIRSRQSRQALMFDYATTTKKRTRRGGNEQAAAWVGAVAGLPDLHKRLIRVNIFAEDFRKVIKSQDSKETFFYLDPPYMQECRTAKEAYKHEMTVEDHYDLLQMCASMEGKFALSGYPSELYYAFQDEFGWRLETCEIDNKSSAKAEKDLKVECLWMNYSPDA